MVLLFLSFALVMTTASIAALFHGSSYGLALGMASFDHLLDVFRYGFDRLTFFEWHRISFLNVVESCIGASLIGRKYPEVNFVFLKMLVRLP